MKKLTLKEFIEKAHTTHNNFYNYSKVIYIASNVKIKIICPVHGEFLQTPAKHLLGQGCQKCGIESNGEKQIVQILNNYSIKYLREHRFQDCKNKKPLPFDFYLPKHNTCIEYDGKGHYQPVKHWGGESGLKQVQKNDNIKNMYCYKNHIQLLRIKYDQDLNSILRAYLDIIEKEGNNGN